MKANLDILPLSSWIDTAGKPLIIAGPCSAETEEQVSETVSRIAKEGYAHVIRAGVWKPRTRPGSFEGISVSFRAHGKEGLLPVSDEC